MNVTKKVSQKKTNPKNYYNIFLPTSPNSVAAQVAMSAECRSDSPWAFHVLAQKF